MRTKNWLAALVTTATVMSPAYCNPSFVSGEVTHTGIQKLSSQINWYGSLGQAEAEAMREHKMVFYIHILGSIDGAT